MIDPDLDRALDALDRGARLAFTEAMARTAQMHVDDGLPLLADVYAAVARAGADAGERAKAFGANIDGMMAEAAGILVVGNEAPGDEPPEVA